MEKKGILIRVSEEQKKVIEEAARKTTLSVSAWIKNVIVVEAYQQLGKEMP